jgi:hypothetical protein
MEDLTDEDEEAGEEAPFSVSTARRCLRVHFVCLHFYLYD